MGEIHWLAGYLEGEGSFYRRDTKYGSMQVRAHSTDRESLEKCLKFFGGKLYGPYHSGKKTEKEYWQWSTAGPRALGIALTLYSLLSPRRQGQIETMIERDNNHSIN